jgi:hypothetical protein
MTDRRIQNPHDLLQTPRNADINSRQTSRSQQDIYTADEIIGVLANAHENKRARQVFEWESAQSAFGARHARR